MLPELFIRRVCASVNAKFGLNAVISTEVEVLFLCTMSSILHTVKNVPYRGDGLRRRYHGSWSYLASITQCPQQVGYLACVSGQPGGPRLSQT
jgi:hypothetical protein